jgi:hypothetical protein
MHGEKICDKFCEMGIFENGFGFIDAISLSQDCRRQTI